ncbi:PAS domain S-box protein [bacterium]|nr:PAS domain S-box protein [bacterium]
MNTSVRILILEDFPSDLELVKYQLKKSDLSLTIHAVDNRGDFERELTDFSPDLILSDYNLPQFTALDALKRLKERQLATPLILVTGTQSDEIAVECLKAGAEDYILKNNLTRLNSAIHNVLQKRDTHREKEAALTALKESETRYRNLFENSTDMVYTLDTKGCATSLNPAFKTITGFEPQEWIGKHFSEIIHRSDFEYLRELFKSVMTGTTVPPSEIRLLQKDGHYTFVEFTAVPLYELGEINGVLGIVRDISGRKHAEEQIREQADLLNLTRDIIILKRLEGEILFWNQAAEKVLGWTTKEVLGKSVFQLQLRGKERFHQNVYKELLEKSHWQGEVKLLTKSGNEILVDSRWTLIKDGNRNHHTILTVNTDVTEQRKLEAQFYRAQRLESIGTLASGIAHDLNNMLMPIMLAAHILSKKAVDDEGHNLLQTIQSSAEQGANLIKQVLSFGRGMEGERTLVQLRYLIKDVYKILEKTFPKNIDVQIIEPKELALVNANSTQLHQVLMNLCVNARDAMPNGGTLTIETTELFIDEHYAQIHIDAKSGSYVIIRVTDSGTGIPDSIKEKIFDPFFTTKEPGQGTGLGLATVFNIVKGHGGFITLISEHGQGTTFKIYIPSVAAENEKQATDTQLKWPAGHGEWLLVVEDNASVREITRTTLESYGYHVLTANDGAEAVGLFAQNRSMIKAVILDMSMPIMDGPSTIRALKKIDPDIAIIGVSGLQASRSLDKNLATELFAFIQKPYTTLTLLTTLNDLLNKNPKNPNSI